MKPRFSGFKTRFKFIKFGLRVFPAVWIAIITKIHYITIYISLELYKFILIYLFLRKGLGWLKCKKCIFNNLSDLSNTYIIHIFDIFDIFDLGTAFCPLTTSPWIFLGYTRDNKGVFRKLSTETNYRLQITIHEVPCTARWKFKSSRGKLNSNVFSLC